MLLLVTLAALLLPALAVPDWLVTTITDPVEFTQLSDTTYILTNGLIARLFTTQPDFGTINFYSYTAEASLMRAIYPEAMVVIDGVLLCVVLFDASVRAQPIIAQGSRTTSAATCRRARSMGT
jgi:hypothetical protein